MARPLVLRFEGAEIPLALEKVDRSKLYGFVERETLDESGKPCMLVTLLADGRTLAGKGGVASVMISQTGEWLDRTKLAAVDATGAPLVPVPSSFAAPIDLVKTATTRDVLGGDVRLLYHVTVEEPLLAALRAGTIFTFPYSFRGGLQADVAFLLASAAGDTFLLVCEPHEARFLSLRKATGLVGDDDNTDEGAEESDELDFAMM